MVYRTKAKSSSSVPEGNGNSNPKLIFSILITFAVSSQGRLLTSLTTCSDVLSTVLQNSVLIASTIRSEYLDRTNSLVEAIESLPIAGGSPLEKKKVVKDPSSTVETSEILESLRDNRVGSLDGGQGKGLLGTTIPFILRTVVFSVKLGDRSSSREDFTPSYFMANELSAGAMGAEEELLAAILEIFELKSALLTVEQHDIDILLLHGPLTRSFSVFLGDDYYISESDIEVVVGKDLTSDYKNWKSSLSPTQQKSLDRFSSFGLIVFLLSRLIKAAEKKGTLICGVIERTTSTEVTQQILYKNITGIYSKNEDWFKKVTGLPLKSPQDEYIKLFLDRLGYTDSLILGSLLQKGECTEWREGRANRYQPDNRKNFGLPIGFITGQKELSDLVPVTNYSYIRTSNFNAPFRVEIPEWLNSAQRDKLIRSVYAFSQFLPQYAFPVNLDIVDKLAKVPNWITNAFVGMITKEIYDGVASGKGLTIDYSQMLSGKFRDWDIRPGVRKKIV